VTDNNTLTIDVSHGMVMLWTVGAAAHSLFDYLMWHMIACGHTERKCCRFFGWSMAVSLVMITVALTSFVVLLRACESPSTTTTESDSLTILGLDDTQYAVGGLWDCDDQPWYISADRKCTNDRIHTQSDELFENMQMCCEQNFGLTASCGYRDVCIEEETDMSSLYQPENELEVSDFQYLHGCLLELAISLFVYTPMMQIILFSGILGCGVLPVLGGRFYTLRNERRVSAVDA